MVRVLFGSGGFFEPVRQELEVESGERIAHGIGEAGAKEYELNRAISNFPIVEGLVPERN